LLCRTAKGTNATAIGPRLFSGWTTELAYCLPTQTASEGKNNQKLQATAFKIATSPRSQLNGSYKIA